MKPSLKLEDKARRLKWSLDYKDWTLDVTALEKGVSLWRHSTRTVLYSEDSKLRRERRGSKVTSPSISRRVA